MKEKQEESQRVLFLDNGLEALELFDICMKTCNIPYTLAFGTLLGAVREHGFIKHDIDIDVTIWDDDRRSNQVELLHNYGFELEHSFLVENGNLGREETYVYKGVHLDIFYIYPAITKQEYPYCCDFLGRGCFTYEGCMEKYGSVLPRRLEMPFIKKIKNCSFNGLELPIPDNAEELLTYRYGPDYMIPNPNWGIQSHNQHIIEWTDMPGIYIKNI